MENKQDKNWTVYMHKNKINGKRYVGITGREPKTRWGQNGKNYKRQLYFWNAIKKYGWNNFEHIILRSNLSEEEANFLERWLIKKYKLKDRNYGYNVVDGGNTKTPYVIFGYDINNGSFIGKWKEAAIAANYLNIPSAGIYGCCRGDYKSFRGYYFSYKNYGNKLPKDIFLSIQNNSHVNIAQYDQFGNFVNVFKSIQDAAIQFNGSRPNVDRHMSMGYIWKRVDMFNDDSYKNNLSIEELNYALKEHTGKIEICQYDLNGKFIRTYKNAKEAAKYVDGDYLGILRVCRKSDYYILGYIWRFSYMVNVGEDLSADDPSVIEYNKNNTTVFQYDAMGHFIASYVSAGDASKCTGINKNGIKMSAYKKYARTSNYLWRYEKDGYIYGEDLPLNEFKKPKSYKTVAQYTLDNQYIATYESCAAAGRAIGRNGRDINACINGDQKTAFGYIWKVINDEK